MSCQHCTPADPVDVWEGEGMSATDRLRALLEENGLDWFAVGPLTGCSTAVNGGQYPASIDPWGANGTFTVKLFGLTPEQAIAATLGSGTLTAEQVREAIFNNSTYANYDGAQYYASGMHMQAIADELNGVLGSGTCKWELEHSGTLYDKWRCSACGFLFVESRTDQGIKEDFEPNFCPRCGRKVVN